jgi:hypothetical protein
MISVSDFVRLPYTEKILPREVSCTLVACFRACGVPSAPGCMLSCDELRPRRPSSLRSDGT